MFTTTLIENVLAIIGDAEKVKAEWAIEAPQAFQLAQATCEANPFIDSIVILKIKFVFHGETTRTLSTLLPISTESEFGDDVDSLVQSRIHVIVETAKKFKLGNLQFAGLIIYCPTERDLGESDRLALRQNNMENASQLEAAFSGRWNGKPVAVERYFASTYVEDNMQNPMLNCIELHSIKDDQTALANDLFTKKIEDIFESELDYEEHQQLLAEVRAEVKPLEDYLEKIFFASDLTLIEPEYANDDNYALDA